VKKTDTSPVINLVNWLCRMC